MCENVDVEGMVMGAVARAPLILRNAECTGGRAQ